MLSESALLILVASPKLVDLGVLQVTDHDKWASLDAEDALRRRIGARHANAMQSSRAFKALRAEIVSFARAYQLLRRSHQSR